MSNEINDPSVAASSTRSFVGPIRIAVGGVFMGVANLIPGVSGGTMILAVGLYEEFIDAVAELTALKFSVRRILFLGILGCFAVASILGLSSVILSLLLWHSSFMFALFIGLTLGGTPLLLRMIGRSTWSVVIAAFLGLALMAGVALVRQGAAMPRNMGMDFVSGVVGATTMVLPGISGSYMLLVLDQYDRVIGAISDLKGGALESLKIIIPVGIGAVLGIVALSNLLKLLLHKFEKATLGFLLGMLLGSVLGLWPFGRAPTEKILERASDVQLQQYVADRGISGADGLSQEALRAYIVEHWEQRTANDYQSKDILGAVIALCLGVMVTVLIGRFGSRVEPSGEFTT